MRKNYLSGNCMVVSLLILMLMTAGCDNPFAPDLEKGDRAFQKGDYSRAIQFYLRAAEEYNAALGRTYLNRDEAKADAMKLVEIYMKMGLTYEKLQNEPAARAAFEKAAESDYSITFGWYEKEQVWVEGEYKDEWVPGYYRDVYVDGHYERRYVDGCYKDVWVEGHYEQRYVNGYWKKRYVPAHYENVSVLKTRTEQISITSVYIDRAKARLESNGETRVATAGMRISETAGDSSINLNNQEIPGLAAGVLSSGASNEKRAAYERMVNAWRAWVDAGAPADGMYYLRFAEARKEYEALPK